MKYRGFEINIEQDMDASNPRTEWDNVGTMVCFHRRYDLGDKHEFRDPDHFDDWMKEQGSIHGEIACILKLYLYDHSGITISTAPFSCPWDSGQVGYVYVTFETLKQEGITTDKAEDILKSEVEVYDNYLTGEVYGYNVQPLPGNKLDCNDSCWGYYGQSGREDAIMDAKGAIDFTIAAYRADAAKAHQTRKELDRFMGACWAF